MAGAQVEIVANQIEAQRLGYMGLSLTNYDADTEPQIAAGSKVEVGGALFEFTALESITGWSGIGNDNGVYIKLVVSGTDVTAEFTATAPTWSTSKQGWYAGLDRYVAKLRKDGAGAYTLKRMLAAKGSVIKPAVWEFLTGTDATFVAPWTGFYMVKAYGAGGGGGGSTGGSSGGGGGGGGKCSRVYALAKDATLAFTVGAAGAGGLAADGNGGAGGITTVTDGVIALTATGGGGGAGRVAHTPGIGGIGNGSKVDDNRNGEPGTDGVGFGAHGGRSPGGAQTTGGTGAAGSPYGGGGAGNTTGAGGDGATGAVIIEAWGMTE